MSQTFANLLAEGQHRNSILNVDKVIILVDQKPERLEELYQCVFHDDAWVRMRAMDGLEKICRQHPAWLEPYLDRMNAELATSPQASIQWHLAQIYSEVDLTEAQQAFAIDWLCKQVSTTDVDWIVAANCMTTLVQFAQAGAVSKSIVKPLLEVQLDHHSKSVVRRATKLLQTLG